MSAKSSKPSGVLGALAGVAGFSALAGLLAAIMVTPAIAVTGMTASSTIGIFEDLPEYIEIDQQAQKNEIYANSDAGPTLIATVYDQNREEVGWDDISQFVKDAAIAGEDRRFYEHGGVDLQGVIRAAVGNFASGGVESGASTITMQLVRNIYIQRSQTLPTEEERDAAYAEAVEQSFTRKLNEMKLAIGLEKEYSKEEILLAYLNIADFNANTYGIQAAAERYYSTSAKDLTLAQAASLIAIVQYPNAHGLSFPENYEANKARRDIILHAMLDEGMIDQAQFDEAIATPVDESTVRLSEPRNGCTYAHDAAKQFCDYIVKNVRNLEALGATEEERLENWERGGYEIYGTLDLELQMRAQELNRQYAPWNFAQMQLGSATSSVEVGTGRIIVMAQNKEFNDTRDGGGPTATAVNFNTDRDYGGSSGFQVGSTYKLFTLLNWLQSGHGLNEVVDGSLRTFNQASFTDSCNPGWAGPWKPANAGASPATASVMQATAASINTAYLDMALQLDLCGIRNTAESVGVHRADGQPLTTNPGSVIGDNEIAPLTMAAAYAAVANQGRYCDPVAVDKVIGPEGEELPGQSANCRQAIEPEVAAGAAHALAGVMSGGTGVASNPWDGTPIIGKTGTTDDSVQTWIVTSTTKVTTAQWVGNIVGKISMNRVYTGASQGSVARHYITRSLMAAVNAQYGGDPFPSASAAMLTGQGAFVPDVAGQSLEQARTVIEAQRLRFEHAGEVDSPLPAGQVAQTDPAGGTKVPRGTTIRVYTSNGSQSALPDVTGRTVDEARQVLEDAGFTNVDVRGGGDGSAIVTETSPAGGSTVSKDTRVTLRTDGGGGSNDDGGGEGSDD